MRASSSSFSLGLFLFACTTSPPGDADTTGGTSDPSMTSAATDDPSSTGADSTGGGLSGEELFAQFCVSCHGLTAEGSALGYELRHPAREYARWVIRNGRAGTELAPSVMAAYPEGVLADADVDAILDYLGSFEKPTTGEGLYLDYCRNCHGVDASGGEAEKDIRFELGDALEKVRQGEGGTNYGARKNYMPGVSADELSDQDVAAIVAYVEGL